MQVPREQRGPREGPGDFHKPQFRRQPNSRPSGPNVFYLHCFDENISERTAHLSFLQEGWQKVAAGGVNGFSAFLIVGRGENPGS